MKLEEYEEMCDVCNGIGEIEDKLCIKTCTKCKGFGKLDWLEKILGKKQKLKKIFLVRNVCNSDILIHDLGINISSKSYFDLSITHNVQELRNSNDLKNETNSGLLKIVENNMGI